MWELFKKIFVKEVNEMDRYKAIKLVDAGKEKYIDRQRLHKLIVHHLGDIVKDCNITLPDAEYYLPPASYVTQVLKLNAIDKKKYVSESGDCDDYAYLAKALFIKLRWTTGKPMAFGVIHGMLPKGHAINFFIANDEQLYFIEPQSDKLFPVNTNIKEAWFIYV
jgi:hypothetical protein